MAATAATRDSTASDLDILHELNHNYVRSVQEADVAGSTPIWPTISSTAIRTAR